MRPVVAGSERGEMAGTPGSAASSFYVVGGQQRHARAVVEQGAGWYKFARGLILQVDAETGATTDSIDYVSPAEVCAPEEPAILFKSASLAGERLYACTQTEVLVFDLATWQLVSYISLPIFNDVHHVLPTADGTLLVAISGLDLVVEVTSDGDVLREWNTAGIDTWARFSRACDYRRVASTKPHHSHPNHLFRLGADYWVTRFEQRDALNLSDSTQRIEIGLERVHDGVVAGGRVYFTTVDGHVAIFDAATLALERVVDLNVFHQADALLGWCRGLHVDGQRLWVGFSKLRMTRFRQNLSWVRTGFRTQLPTRIDCYDLAEERLLHSFDLQQHGLDAVFSILPVPLKGDAGPAMRSA